MVVKVTFIKIVLKPRCAPFELIGVAHTSGAEVMFATDSIHFIVVGMNMDLFNPATCDSPQLNML
jgi:hypothetical protein